MARRKKEYAFSKGSTFSGCTKYASWLRVLQFNIWAHPISLLENWVRRNNEFEIPPKSVLQCNCFNFSKFDIGQQSFLSTTSRFIAPVVPAFVTPSGFSAGRLRVGVAPWLVLTPMKVVS